MESQRLTGQRNAVSRHGNAGASTDVDRVASLREAIASDDLARAIELDEGDCRGAQRPTRIDRAQIANVGVHCALFDKQVSRDMLVPGREIDRSRPGAGGNDIDTVLRRRGLVLHQHAVAHGKRHAVDGHGA